MLDYGGLTMQNWLVLVIEEYGYIGILILMMIENIFPPIPSEIVLTFAGLIISKDYLSIIGVITTSTLGSYLGGTLLYLIGYCLSKNIMIKKQLFQRLHFQEHDIRKTEKWFLKYGNKAIFLGRLVPVIRSLISLPAGFSKMSFIQFSLYTLLGTLLWNSVLIFLGIYLGNQWEFIQAFINEYKMICLIVLISLGGCWMAKKKFLLK